LFNSLKDKSLASPLVTKIKEDPVKELKKAISENRKCEICTTKTKEAKYIGF
jgi:hypothetical protein